MKRFKFKNQSSKELAETLAHLCTVLKSSMLISDKECRIFKGDRSIGFRMLDVEEPLPDRKIKKDPKYYTYYVEVLPRERLMYQDLKEVAKKGLKIKD